MKNTFSMYSSSSGTIISNTITISSSHHSSCRSSSDYLAARRVVLVHIVVVVVIALVAHISSSSYYLAAQRVSSCCSLFQQRWLLSTGTIHCHPASLPWCSEQTFLQPSGSRIDGHCAASVRFVSSWCLEPEIRSPRLWRTLALPPAQSDWPCVTQTEELMTMDVLQEEEMQQIQCPDTKQIKQSIAKYCKPAQQNIIFKMNINKHTAKLNTSTCQQTKIITINLSKFT